MSGEQARLDGTISLEMLTPKATASERQKAEECLPLTRFRETSGQLPGTLERVVQDPPEFLITAGSHTTSVEMTRSLQRAGKRGSPDAQREARREVNAARHSHRQADPPACSPWMLSMRV